MRSQFVSVNNFVEDRLVKIVESHLEAYAHVDHWRKDGLRIGVVPTMGALHAGHLALAERSVKECDITVATIFVNPTQFGPQEDLSRYPRTLEADCELLRGIHVDLLFAPSPDDLYPPGYSTFVEPPQVAVALEGEFRPGHFRGVATVVLKLFQIIPAHIAYFGQKDYQQLAVIRRMVDDLQVPIRVEGCPTVREPDGLAMSSRNRYLSEADRRMALSLWDALQLVRTLAEGGESCIAVLEQTMRSTLVQAGISRVDYARIVDGETLERLTQLDRPAVALIAAFVGRTRLIDNVQLEPLATWAPENPCRA